ncbi:MAG TPA: hypothetical protein VM580_03385 [Labilithrix sp.]|nr:hypothetical protein [Labilithrix sp.]
MSGFFGLRPRWGPPRAWTWPLVVHYDPFAPGAEMFIEQYQRQIDACDATTSTNMTKRMSYQ